jgi:hypothetical protein
MRFQAGAVQNIAKMEIDVFQVGVFIQKLVENPYVMALLKG